LIIVGGIGVGIAIAQACYEDHIVEARSHEILPTPNLFISRFVSPTVAKSASTSPIAGENLKPCPEQGEATTIRGWPGMVIGK
jgi:hypothetical protein